MKKRYYKFLLLFRLEISICKPSSNLAVFYLPVDKLGVGGQKAVFIVL